MGLCLGPEVTNWALIRSGGQNKTEAVESEVIERTIHAVDVTVFTVTGSDSQPFCTGQVSKRGEGAVVLRWCLDIFLMTVSVVYFCLMPTTTNSSLV